MLPIFQFCPILIKRGLEKCCKKPLQQPTCLPPNQWKLADAHVTEEGKDFAAIPGNPSFPSSLTGCSYMSSFKVHPPQGKVVHTCERCNSETTDCESFLVVQTWGVTFYFDDTPLSLSPLFNLLWQKTRGHFVQQQPSKHKKARQSQRTSFSKHLLHI